VVDRTSEHHTILLHICCQSGLAHTLAGLCKPDRCLHRSLPLRWQANSQKLSQCCYALRSFELLLDALCTLHILCWKPNVAFPPSSGCDAPPKQTRAHFHHNGTARSITRMTALPNGVLAARAELRHLDKAQGWLRLAACLGVIVQASRAASLLQLGGACQIWL
jgi:hypothetical protein